MTWEAVLIGYLLVGAALSTVAGIGHRIRFGHRMPWLHWLVGALIWPAILLFGKEK